MEIEGVSLLKQNRVLVTRLAEAGLTPKEINKLSIPNLPPSTVYVYYDKHQNGQNFDNRKNAGRESILDESDWMLIVGALESKTAQTCVDLAQIVKKEHNKTVHPETIRLHLHKHQMRYKHPLKVPFLTPEQKADRVIWAKEHLHDNWSKTLFSDESSFWLDTNSVCRWMPINEVNYNPTRKYPPKVHVWAAIHPNGVIGPVFFRENMDGELYTDILNYVWSDIKAIMKFTTNWRFQQDGDSKHTCTKSIYFMMKHKVPLLQWPSGSPDLSPIENVWNVIKRDVEIQNPQTLDELEGAITERFKKIDKNLLLSLYESMTKRLKQCIERNGDKVDY